MIFDALVLIRYCYIERASAYTGTCVYSGSSLYLRKNEKKRKKSCKR